MAAIRGPIYRTPDDVMYEMGSFLTTRERNAFGRTSREMNTLFLRETAWARFHVHQLIRLSAVREGARRNPYAGVVPYRVMQGTALVWSGVLMPIAFVQEYQAYQRGEVPSLCLGMGLWVCYTVKMTVVQSQLTLSMLQTTLWRNRHVNLCLSVFSTAHGVLCLMQGEKHLGANMCFTGAVLALQGALTDREIFSFFQRTYARLRVGIERLRICAEETWHSRPVRALRAFQRVATVFAWEVAHDSSALFRSCSAAIGDMAGRTTRYAARVASEALDDIAYCFRHFCRGGTRAERRHLLGENV